MGASITLAGESLIATKQSKREVLAVARFVLANIPGLDTTLAVDRAAALPPAAQVVKEVVVTREGYISPNKVVYSLMLDTTIGDFDFNYIGLVTTENVLLIAAYVPLQQKRKEIVPTQAGNNLTRNIVLEYNGAQSLTGIQVPASTWQFDFTEKFSSIASDMAQLRLDVDKKLNADALGSVKSVSLDGPVIVYPGSTNTYKITDYNRFSTFKVAASVGTVAISADTITLTIATGTASGLITLDVTRDDVKVSFKVPLGVAAIEKPTLTVPANMATGVGFEPTLTSSTFSVLPAGFEAQAKTRWQIATDAAFTVLVMDKEGTTNLKSITLSDVGVRLNPSTRYYARVRYSGPTLTSDWSTVIYFNTASVYVRKPAITFPVDGSDKVSLAGRLKGDAFSVYGGADTHQASRWQISTVADFSTVVQDSGWSTSQLTEFVPPSSLTRKTQYYARVSYRGNATPQSEWSATVGFITAEPLNGTSTLVGSGATARDTHTLTSIAGALYAMGGYSTAVGVNQGKTLWRYDVASNAWQQKASAPINRSRHAAATVGGMLYVFGGSTDGGSTLTADFSRYDPASDTWATLQVGPSARAWAGMVEVGGDLYVLGGGAGAGGSNTKDVWKYTVATNKWTQLGDMPAALNYSLAVAIGGKVYVLAGFVHYIWDVASNTWTSGAAPIVSVDRGAGAGVSGFLYTVGGTGAVSGESSTYNHVQEYDPATDKWRRLANLPVTRFLVPAAECNGALYVFGGQQNSPNIVTNTLYRID
ncbi:phage tail protein [Pseudomonas sp. NPDC087358]|uniref:Kelch repeat-containing protein n=1 Tax=Pseudomonas sp. NPDC087358 TaxID=3364439 RepID=UPI003850BDB4